LHPSLWVNCMKVSIFFSCFFFGHIRTNFSHILHIWVFFIPLFIFMVNYFTSYKISTFLY
jgi:hypothetical protein